MAVTQNGTGSLTIAGGATGTLDQKAAVYITVPAGAIVESVEVSLGGSPDFEDQKDALGAFHTRFTYEKGQHEATVVISGKEYSKQAGDVDGASSNYYVLSAVPSFGKGAVRTTIRVQRLPTIA
jgi:hypothetical protein